MANPHVFLSYCHDNAKEAQQLHDELVQTGFEVWWDKKILGGQDWRLEIRKAMKNCFAVVACFSKEVQARDASGMYPELRDAIEAYRELSPGSVFLVPVRFSTCDIPPLRIDATLSLDGLQRIDLFPPSKRVSGFSELAQALQAAPKCPAPRNAPTGSRHPSAAAAPMTDPEIRKALTNLSPTDFATLLANVSGASRQVSDGTIPQKAAQLIQWVEAHGGPGLTEIGRIAADVLPNFR